MPLSVAVGLEVGVTLGLRAVANIVGLVPVIKRFLCKLFYVYLGDFLSLELELLVQFELELDFDLDAISLKLEL